MSRQSIFTLCPRQRHSEFTWSALWWKPPSSSRTLNYLCYISVSCLCIRSCLPVSTQVCGSHGTLSEAILRDASHVPLRQGFLRSPGIMSRLPRASHLAFLCGLWGPNSNLHAHQTCSFLTELSLQPITWILNDANIP